MTAPSAKNQPQIIKSTDNTLQTLHHRMAVNRFGHRVVEGVMKNAGSESSVNAEITVEYYSADGTLIGTEGDILRGLKPGKTGAFEVVYSGELRWEIKHYKITSLKQV